MSRQFDEVISHGSIVIAVVPLLVGGVCYFYVTKDEVGGERTQKIHGILS